MYKHLEFANILVGLTPLSLLNDLLCLQYYLHELYFVFFIQPLMLLFQQCQHDIHFFNYLFNLILFICLYLRCISGRQYLVALKIQSCFLIQSETLNLLIRVLRPFIFNINVVIIDFKSSILLVVLHMFHLFLFCVLLD